MSQTRYDIEIANDKTILSSIANMINKSLERKITIDEAEDLLNFIRSNRSHNWTGMSKDKICAYLVRTFISSRMTVKGRETANPDITDIHEIMKAHIGTGDQESNYDEIINVDANGNPLNANTGSSNGQTADKGLGSINNIRNIDNVTAVTTIGNITGLLGKTDEISLQQMINPKAAYRKNYVLLDTRYRDTTQDSINSQQIRTISWNFLMNTATPAMGGINSLGDVQQVVAMSTGNIRLPYQNNVLINNYKRVSMLINEWSGQSFIGQEGRKFHIMFSAELDMNMIECNALPNGTAVFEFAKPITQLDTITLSFGCPLEPIIFDMDRQSMLVSYQNPAVFTGPVGHKLQTGDQVYISGFTTSNPAVDNAIITQANSPNGYNITVLDDTTISVQLDLTGVISPINPLSVSVYFGSKRIFVPLELTYIPYKKKL